MTPADPYRVLQVHPEADREIIQVAYRKLAQRYHPDVARDPDAARRMAELNAARDLLVDPVARAAYDRAHRSADGGVGGTRSRDDGRGDVAAEPGSTGDTSTTGGAPAGPPPGNPSGSVLGFGRYVGWSLGEIARRDLEYVEWLDRIPIGRPYRGEIDAILRHAGRRGGTARPEEPRGLFRRR
jgi:curved DNA-binding protein CbpA